MNKVNVYQQRPDKAHAEAPLHYAGLERMVGQSRQNAGVRVRHHKLLGHLILRGDVQNPDFAASAQQALGLALPGALGVVSKDELSVQWMAPDEWLLIVAQGEELLVEQRLRAALQGVHHAVVNVSGGQTLLELSGPAVRDVLMKSTPYDVHPQNFPVGKAVGSTFAKSQLVIRRTGDDVWQLVVRRSFADYVWAWLQDASAEFGLAVDG